MLVADVVRIVVVRVLGHAAVEVRPRQNILEQGGSARGLIRRRAKTNHSILLVLENTDGNIGQEVVVQEMYR